MAAPFDGVGGVQLQEWNLQTWAESLHPLCSERLQCLWLPCTMSTWKNTWKASPDFSTIQMPNYRPNLLWSEMSVSFFREEQAYPWYHNSNIGLKTGTLSLLLYKYLCFPSIRTKSSSSFCLSNQKQNFYVPSRESSLMMRPRCQAFPAPCISYWNTMASWSSQIRVKGSL